MLAIGEYIHRYETEKPPEATRVPINKVSYRLRPSTRLSPLDVMLNILKAPGYISASTNPRNYTNTRELALLFRSPMLFQATLEGNNYNINTETNVVYQSRVHIRVRI
jgi:hypothetical protein